MPPRAECDYQSYPCYIATRRLFEHLARVVQSVSDENLLLTWHVNDPPDLAKGDVLLALEIDFSDTLEAFPIVQRHIDGRDDLTILAIEQAHGVSITTAPDAAKIQVKEVENDQGAEFQ